jgi:hypothetical protein
MANGGGISWEQILQLNKFLIEVTCIFILMQYKRNVTETALPKSMMLRGW